MTPLSQGSRYHTHLSHILRLILAYLIHKYIKIYDRLFNKQSIYTTKRYTCFGSARYNTRQKQNKTKPHSALIPHGVPYASQMPA